MNTIKSRGVDIKVDDEDNFVSVHLDDEGDDDIVQGDTEDDDTSLEEDIESSKITIKRKQQRKKKKKDGLEISSKKTNRNCIIYGTLFSVLIVIIIGCGVGIYVCRQNRRKEQENMTVSSAPAHAPAPATLTTSDSTTMLTSSSSGSVASSSHIDNEHHSIEPTVTEDEKTTNESIQSTSSVTTKTDGTGIKSKEDTDTNEDTNEDTDADVDVEDEFREQPVALVEDDRLDELREHIDYGSSEGDDKDVDTNTMVEDGGLDELKEHIDYDSSEGNDEEVETDTTTATMTDTNEEEDNDKVTEWPELVGLTGEEAKTKLESMYGVGTYNIHILNENDPTSRDYRYDRIRIFVNEETNLVTIIPRIG